MISIDMTTPLYLGDQRVLRQCPLSMNFVACRHDRVGTKKNLSLTRFYIVLPTPHQDACDMVPEACKCGLHHSSFLCWLLFPRFSVHLDVVESKNHGADTATRIIKITHSQNSTQVTESNFSKHHLVSWKHFKQKFSLLTGACGGGTKIAFFAFPDPPPDDAPPTSTSTSSSAPKWPMTASGAYFSMTSGGWIMSNSAVASFPAKVRIANSPPGCCDKKLVTLSTRLWRTTQQSVFVVCFPTSSIEKPVLILETFLSGPLGTPMVFLFMLSSYEPPACFEPSTFPERPPPDNSAREVSLMSSPSMYFAHAFPATRPNTTQSRSEFPPRRLFPCTPPATSPAA